jgi:hypothetical protein
MSVQFHNAEILMANMLRHTSECYKRICAQCNTHMSSECNLYYSFSTQLAGSDMNYAHNITIHRCLWCLVR